MVKYKDIEFSTIYSQETIKNNLEKIVSDGSIFNDNNLNKIFSGFVNLYNFEIHNKNQFFMHRAINFWRILIKGTMMNSNNLTNVKIRTRLFHGEIIYMYFIFLFILTLSISMGIKTIIPPIVFGIFFVIITLYTIIKTKKIDDEISLYKKLIVKTITE
jgi:hypothetical protein